MYVGTQIEPRDDSDYQVWAQLGVTHVCVDPPGSPDEWSLDALHRHKDHIESFGLSLDMVQLPISSGPLVTSPTCWSPTVPNGSARSIASAGLSNGLLPPESQPPSTISAFSVSLARRRRSGAVAHATRRSDGAGPT